MTFVSIAILLKWLQIACATSVVVLVIIQVFRSKSNPKSASATFLKYATVGFFMFLLGGVAFANYYVSTAPRRLASLVKVDPQAAISGYTAAIRLSPQSSDLYFRRAMNHIRLQQYGDAVSDFSKALEQSPDNPKFLANRALAYASLNNYRAADADIKGAVQVGYKSSEMAMLQGVLASEKGQYQEAKNYYTEALSGKLGPTNYCYALIDRSYASTLMQDYTSALTDLNKGLEDCKSESNQEDLLVNRGVVYKLMNRSILALADWNAAEKLDPKDAVIYKNRGGLRIEQGKFEEALEDFRRYTAIRTNDAFGFNKLAELYGYLGQREMAKLNLSKANELLETGKARLFPSIPLIGHDVSPLDT